jgi:hypothetical protein
MRHAILAGTLLALLAGCDESVKRNGDGGRRDSGDAGAVDQPGPTGEGLPPDKPGNLHPDATKIDPSKDTDKDGLPDDWETLYGLDPSGTNEASEDKDGDGLTNLEEWACWQLSASEGQKCSPKHKDLILRVDYQQGKAPSSWVISESIKSFAAADLSNLDGTTGIALHVVTDQKDLAVEAMSSDLSARLSYLGAHGPKLSSKAATKMVHVMFVSTRPDSPNTGGDTMGSDGLPPSSTGVLIYVDNLAAIFPCCLAPTGPKLTLDQGVLGTFVHEVGHTLQLGHDTAVGGGVNPYNIMSLGANCAALRQRDLGEGNTDPSIGATAAAAGPRFSKAAAALIKLNDKISVETSHFDSGEGYEM